MLVPIQQIQNILRDPINHSDLNINYNNDRITQLSQMVKLNLNYVKIFQY